jgi:hypothetical protein
VFLGLFFTILLALSDGIICLLPFRFVSKVLTLSVLFTFTTLPLYNGLSITPKPVQWYSCNSGFKAFVMISAVISVVGHISNIPWPSQINSLK